MSRAEHNAAASRRYTSRYRERGSGRCPLQKLPNVRSKGTKESPCAFRSTPVFGQSRSWTREGRAVDRMARVSAHVALTHRNRRSVCFPGPIFTKRALKMWNTTETYARRLPGRLGLAGARLKPEEASGRQTRARTASAPPNVSNVQKRWLMVRGNMYTLNYQSAHGTRAALVPT